MTDIDEGRRLVSIVFLTLAIVGALLLVVAPKTDEYRRRLGLAFFVGGMAGVAGMFLLRNPEVFDSAQEHIALTLIGMVIAFFSILRFLKR